MDPFIRTALDRADARARRSTAGSRTSSTPSTWHPARRHLPDVRQGRHDDRDRSGTASGSTTSAAPDLVDVGARAAARPAGSRRSAGAAKLPWNLEWAAQWCALRRDDRAVRQGPLDGRRLARPQRRDRPRGVRARAAAQRPVRVPQHRRQEDVDLQGARRRRAPIAEVVPPEQLRFLFLRPRPNHAIDFDPRAPTRSRGCSTSSTVRRGDRGARGEGRAARRATRATFRYSLLRPRRRRRRRGRGLPARRSRTSRCCSRSRASTSPPASPRRRGVPLTAREDAILDERESRRPAAWLDVVRPGAGPDRRPARRPARRGGRRSARSSGVFLGAVALVGRAAPRPTAATTGRPRSSRSPATQGSRPAGRSGRSTWRSSGRTNGPRAGWLLASLEPAFVIERLRAAAGWRPAAASPADAEGIDA